MWIYLLDFDDVLFNLKKFEIDFRNLFPEEFIKKYYDKKAPRPIQGVSKSYYLLTVLKNILHKETKKSAKEILKNFEKYVFEDVLNFLETKNKEQLFILSAGCKKWQMLKIKNSGIADFFDEKIIIASRRPKSEALSEEAKKHNLSLSGEQKICFVDDKKGNITDIKKNFPFILTFLLLREGVKGDSDFSGYDFIVKNLKEVEQILSFF